jgi:hypothetical protein
VVFPASGWEIMANVRRVAASLKISGDSDTQRAYGGDGNPSLSSYWRAKLHAPLTEVSGH